MSCCERLWRNASLKDFLEWDAKIRANAVQDDDDEPGGYINFAHDFHGDPQCPYAFSSFDCRSRETLNIPPRPAPPALYLIITPPEEANRFTLSHDQYVAATSLALDRASYSLAQAQRFQNRRADRQARRFMSGVANYTAQAPDPEPGHKRTRRGRKGGPATHTQGEVDNSLNGAGPSSFVAHGNAGSGLQASAGASSSQGGGAEVAMEVTNAGEKLDTSGGTEVAKVADKVDTPEVKDKSKGKAKETDQAAGKEADKDAEGEEDSDVPENERFLHFPSN